MSSSDIKTNRRFSAIATLANAPLWEKLSRFEGWLSIALITLVGLITYLPWIGKLGFYWEDLYVIWAGLSQGPDFFIPLYAGERPLVGYLYRLIYPLLGNTPLPWQIYALIERLLGALALFWLLRMVHDYGDNTLPGVPGFFATTPGDHLSVPPGAFDVGALLNCAHHICHPG
jgi:hypothetical protein